MSRRLQSAPEGMKATAALTGRKKPAQSNERSAAALGHESQNTSRPEAAKEGGVSSLSEIVQPRRGKSSPADHPDLPYIGLEHVEAHTTRLLGSVPAPEMRSTANRFQPGDVLYSRLRPYLNKVWRADREGLCSSEFIVMPGNERVDSAYLCYRLNAHDFVSFANSLNAGDRPRVDFDQISAFQTWLPKSLPEQRRIVAEIEKQFTRLEAGVTALRRVQANLKRYRAAVLKAACEGRLVPTEAELSRSQPSTKNSQPAYETGAELLARILTERRQNWQGRGHYKKPAALDTAKLFPLPAGWTWATLDALAEIKGGITKDQNRKHTAPARSVPYLRVANVQRGYIDLTEVKEIVTTEDEIRDLALKPGDILFNEGGDRDKLGRGWVWNGELPECIHQNHVFRARLHVAELNPKLVSWYANTFGQKFFFDEGKHTTNLASISMSKLKGLPVPIPPPAEQTRIVAEVERRLSVVEELESVVSANLQRATRLRQSILQKAFTGELTS